MQKLSKYIDKFTELVGWFTAFTLLSLSTLIVYDAFARYLFQSGSIALQELEWHLFDLVMMFAIAYTLKYNQHVRVDLFYEKFSQRNKIIIDLIGSIFLILPFSLLVIFFSIDFIQLSLSQLEGSSDPGGLPMRYLIKSVMFFSFIVVVLQAISEIIKSMNKLKGLS